jgi:cytolysin-activating lysine-acyltransferase
MAKSDTGTPVSTGSQSSIKSSKTEAKSTAAMTDAARPLDEETLKKLAPHIAKVRAQVQENFGKTVMAMMMLPRYRNQTVADLQHLVLEPMIRDRIAMAYPGGEGENADPKTEASANVAGFAIWASVSEEVDQRIREQIKTGTFPLRLKPEDWTSGDINWLLDVIAPSAKLTSAVLANFGKVVKGGNLRLHPLIARLVDEDTLKKLGAEKMGAEKAGDHQ